MMGRQFDQTIRRYRALSAWPTITETQQTRLFIIETIEVSALKSSFDVILFS
jgi:hypothetical protein